MANPNPMYLEQMPYSREHARAMFGGTDPKKLAFLIPNLVTDYGFIVTEFDKTIQSAEWSTAVSAGGGPTAFAYNATRGGTAQALTGATANDAVAIYRAQTFLDPNDNPFMIVRWKANAVTGFSFEIGFSDPKNDEALPGVSDVDTPTVENGVTDILCVHMDTNQTLTTAALVADGTTGSATKTDIGTYTPTADTYQTSILGVRDNFGFCACWDGDGLVGNRRYSVAQGPDGGVMVRPYALFRTRNTTQKTIDIDLICIGWERNG